MGVLRYGTSSWSEPSWVGPFYPSGMRPGDFLSHYATRFDTVEADVTYYRPPDRVLAAGWERKLPSGFLLAAKFPRSIVHGGTGARPDPASVLVPEAARADLDTFLEGMALLGDKCGPLVLQFPYFGRDAFASRAPFLARLDAFLASLPRGFRYAVELRNEAWIDAELCACLARHGAALVLVEIAYMPHPASLARRLEVVTADFAYCRLIGDRKAVEARTQTFERIVLDQSQSLARWAELTRALLGRVGEVFVYANNHYAGHGPDTIRDLAERVGAARA